jgi:hypothetical protein
MAKRPRKGMFRDFKMKDPDKIGRAYNKYHRLVVRDLTGNYDISESELNFLLFAFDFEFFTLDYMSNSYFYRKDKLGARLIYPLMKRDLVFKYYDKLSPKTYEDAMFDEGRFKYRVRYAITQRARLLVQKYYRKLEGDEQINVPF